VAMAKWILLIVALLVLSHVPPGNPCVCVCVTMISLRLLISDQELPFLHLYNRDHSKTKCNHTVLLRGVLRVCLMGGFTWTINYSLN
jgi:hypothetical protein